MPIGAWVLRTATAGLAARLQFTLDEIEDLRIAVDEACAILLSVAPAQTEVTPVRRPSRQVRSWPRVGEHMGAT